MKTSKIPENAVITEYRVPYADTDMMSVVYYANYLTYFERSRNELMRHYGFTYARMEQELGAMLPVREAHVEFYSSAKYDDSLQLAAWVEEARGVRIKIHSTVIRDGQILAEGYTLHACIDIATRRPIRVPEFLMSLCESK